MSVCEVCGKEYYTRDCLKCRDKIKVFHKDNMSYEESLKRRSNSSEKKELSEKEKLYKVIRYLLIIVFSVFVIISILDVYMMNKTMKQVEPLFKDANKVTNEIMRQHLETMKKINNGFVVKENK